MNRRQFLALNAAFIGGIVLSSRTTARFRQQNPQPDNSNLEVENWLLTTGTPYFAPTISALLEGNPTEIYLPSVAR